MGKAKKTVPVDDLIREALLKIAQAETPLKLTGKGGVFATASGAAKDAIARLRDETPPLIVENGDGKAATVSLAPAGFERIAASIPEDKIPGVVNGIAGGLPPSQRVAFLNTLVAKTPGAVTGLLPLLKEAVAAEKVEAEARLHATERQRELEEASLAALELWKTLVKDRKRQRIEAMQRELAAEGAEDDIPITRRPVAPTDVAPPRFKPTPRPLAFPTDDGDIDFRRNVARRLVSAWVDAWDANNPKARDFLDSAIWNVTGFRLIGETGQTVEFDGQYHEGGPGLFSGDSARVVRPGWVLDEGDDREYVVLKAFVEKA